MGPHTQQPHALVIVRHGETQWSRERRHTGRTDIPLTERGREQAMHLRTTLGRWRFDAVFTSPLRRARDTCALAGLADGAQALDDLMEWDYGRYEGLTAAQIREQRPGWQLWRDGVPDGETLGAVAERAERVLERVRTIDGDVLLIAHGHLLRVLTCCWLQLPPEAGQRFFLGTATPCELGWEHDWTVIRSWNLEARA